MCSYDAFLIQELVKAGTKILSDVSYMVVLVHRNCNKGVPPTSLSPNKTPLFSITDELPPPHRSQQEHRKRHSIITTPKRRVVCGLQVHARRVISGSQVVNMHEVEFHTWQLESYANLIKIVYWFPLIASTHYVNVWRMGGDEKCKQNFSRKIWRKNF
jgi:hypothetical protein